MILRRLVLRNYRKFEDETLVFEEGITGIFGNNGAGKSTVVEAVGWALYGNKVKRTGKDDVKRAGAGHSEECRVELSFDIDGDSYIVKRWLKGKTMTASAELSTASGKVIATGTRAVDEKIVNILGLNKDSFDISVFARQNELAVLSDLDPAERKDYIMKLMGIHRIDRVIALIKSDRKRYEERLEAVHSLLFDAEGRDRIRIIKEELEEKRGGLGEVEQRIIGARNKVEGAKRELESLENSLREMDEMRRRYNGITHRLVELRSRREGYLRDRERFEERLLQLRELERGLPELEGKKNRYDHLRTKMESLERKREKYNRLKEMKKRLEELKGELQSSESSRQKEQKRAEGLEEKESELIEVVGKIEAAEGEIGRLTQELSGMRASIENLRSERMKLSKEMQEIEALGKESECPTCHRPLKDHYPELIREFSGNIDRIAERLAEKEEKRAEMERILEAEKRRLEALRKRKDVLNLEIQNRRVALETVRRMEEEMEVKRKKLEELSRSIREMGDVDYDESQWARLRDEMQAIQPYVERYASVVERLSDIPEVEAGLESAEKAIGELDAAISEQEKMLEEVDFSEKAYNELKQSMSEVSEAYRTQSMELKGLEEQKRSLLEMMDRIENELEELEKRRKETEKIALEKEYLEKLVEILKDGLKMELMGRIRPILSAYSSTFLNEITEGKYNLVELDENYNVRVYDSGASYPIERFSGGEMDLVNLCLRLAISRAVAEFGGASVLNMIILDEVFGSQDADRKRNILRTLAALKGQFSQIILISHMEDVKDSVEHAFMVVEDPEDRTSRIEVI